MQLFLFNTRETWREVKVQWNQLKWAYHDFTDSNMYQHIRMLAFVAVVYFEAVVWASTMIYFLFNLTSRVWPAFMSLSGWIVFAVFGLFYTQV